MPAAAACVPKLYPDAQPEFLKRERLGHVIVGAKAEKLRLILKRRAG